MCRYDRLLKQYTGWMLTACFCVLPELPNRLTAHYIKPYRWSLQALHSKVAVQCIGTPEIEHLRTNNRTHSSILDATLRALWTCCTGSSPIDLICWRRERPSSWGRRRRCCP